MTRPGNLLGSLPAVAIVAGSIIAGLVLLNAQDVGRPEPVAVSSSAPTLASLEALVTASDVVVVGTVVDTDAGRTITAPDDPDAGIRTRLVAVDVSQTLVGRPLESLLIEEAASFTDGTPIAVDGMTQLEVGDRAVWFVVSETTDAMPYYAAVNAQGRYELVGATVRPASDDPLSLALADLGADGLVRTITTE